MCGTCGCGDREIISVEVHESLLKGNDHRAAHLRQHFAEDGVVALNVMGSPGSGKTALLEATAQTLRRHYRIAGVSGDLATDRDAERLRAAGLPARSITTGQACHLDARMIHDVLHETQWHALDFFFIENVGNLVCPAIYDLGQTAIVVLLSVTEGEDKPLKYPIMFKKADLVVVTKIDLAPYLEVDLDALKNAVAQVMPRPRILEVSTKNGLGLPLWIEWLLHLKRQTASPRLAR
jgi:hydrogenase nickel incorporation protein HypB